MVSEANVIKRYELVQDCLFVDAYDLDNLDLMNPSRIPTDIRAAHIMDKRDNGRPIYIELDNVQGVITRFIVMGVDTVGLLPKIIASEYNIAESAAGAEVQEVLDLLEEYFQLRPAPRPYEPPDSPRRQALANLPQDERKKPHSGKYELNFKVNLLGWGGFKIPI